VIADTGDAGDIEIIELDKDIEHYGGGNGQGFIEVNGDRIDYYQYYEEEYIINLFKKPSRF